MSTIAISEGTKERLAAVGKKGDTFEDIVVKLLDFYDDRNGMKGSNTPKSGAKELGGEE